jgi:hypothetical protein
MGALHLFNTVSSPIDARIPGHIGFDSGRTVYACFIVAPEKES